MQKTPTDTKTPKSVDMNTPSNTTPTTAPCTPDYEMTFPESPKLSGWSDIEPNHVVDCNCGCLPLCECPLHFEEYKKKREIVAEYEVNIAYHNNFHGWPIKTEDEIPPWVKKAIELKKFEVFGYAAQEFSTTMTMAEMYDLFETKDWNNHYSILHNYKDDILSLIPIRYRIMPQCYSNGSMLVMMASWLEALLKIVKTVLSGSFDTQDEKDQCGLYQDVFVYEWAWKMFFDYENCPEVIVDDEQSREKKRVLWFLSTTMTSYINFTSRATSYRGFNKNPFSRRSDAQIFIPSRFSRDYQEALFEDFALRIRRARLALNACGYDFISRRDIGITKLHVYRAGTSDLSKWLVPYCSRLGGAVFEYVREKRKMISPSQMILYTIEEFDENQCMCTGDCVNRLIRGEGEFTPCWDKERVRIRRRCKTELKFTRMKRAERPEDQEVPDLEECSPPPKKVQKLE